MKDKTMTEEVKKKKAPKTITVEVGGRKFKVKNLEEMQTIHGINLKRNEHKIK